MKLKHYLGVPFMGTVALLAFTGCSDELESGKNNIPQGNGIVFGASAQYAGPITRVAYGDYVFTEGHEGEFGFRERQDITWESTDQVSIYSPTSPNQQQVDYGIQDNTENTDASEAYLAAINGQDGLQWDRTSETQDFYAVYPSKASITNTQIQNLVSFEDGVLTGYVPINQEHTITKSGNTWTAKPNMNWLYMAAINKGYKVPAPDAEQDGISLDFVPLVTTLEITFVGPTEQPIASFNVESNSEPVTGQFRCDLKQGSTTTAGNFKNVPDCESLQQHTTNTYATVSTYWNEPSESEDGTTVYTRKPLTLAAGEEITFNVFLLPNQDLDNVTIRVAGFNTSSRTLSLKSRDVVLKPHQKTCIRVQAPKINAGETNEWISGLNNNVLVSQLSIPGTANSFSYMYGGTNSHIYQAQTKNIDAQWNAGIRCFELVCSEKYDNYNNNDRSPNVTNLADANLGCNRTNIGMTFGDAVEAIWNKVNGTGEFAIIIPTYESGTGHPGDHNGVISFANALNTFYNSRNYQYQTYSSTLTVGEARGHLLFIARITSEEDENPEDYMPEPAKGIFVDQWGSLKDNWARRGYTISGTVVNNWGTSTTDYNSMESYMLYRGDKVPTNFPTRVDANTNFLHSSTRHDGTKGTAYIQDWMRVVPGSGVINDLRGAGGYTLQDGGWRREDYNVYWNESLTEKQDDIWNTFTRSIQQNSTDNPDAFYINSLDGYFVDQNIRESFTPYVASGTWGVGLSSGGTGGNIGAWATHINNYFYNKILEFGEDNIYGPMNIILMDRVYADDPSSYLPSVIVNNNYRFPLRTADGGTTQNRSSDASYASGGSVWK